MPYLLSRKYSIKQRNKTVSMTIDAASLLSLFLYILDTAKKTTTEKAWLKIHFELIALTDYRLYRGEKTDLSSEHDPLRKML